MEDRLSFCRICAAACGIVVTVEGQQVLRVRGDPGHPVSRGYTCSKGRGLAVWHHSSERLDRPSLRGREATWDETLDDLAGVLGAVVGEQGPDAVALYLATGMAYDAAGQVAAVRWLASLGSRSFYTAATVDNAPVLVAADLVAGQSGLNPVWDPRPTEPALLVLVGTNPVVSHGYGTALPDPIRHLRDFASARGRVWVLDPRRTETAALADEHVPLRPGSDVAVLAALARALLQQGADPEELLRNCDPEQVEALRTALARFTLPMAAAAAGVEVDLLVALVSDLRQRTGRLAMFCGTGTTMAADGVLVEWLRWVLLILTGSLDRPGGMRFHRGLVNPVRPPRAGRPVDPGPVSRPDLPRVAGQVPAVALMDEIEAGHVRALVVTGGNPLTALPEPARTRRALSKLEALVVIDVVAGPLTELATHVLPATGQLERADLTLAEHGALRPGLQSTAAVVDPVAERRPVWWMLGSLAAKLGGVEAATLDDEKYLRGLLTRSSVPADEVFAAGPRGVEVPVEYGWVRETMLADGRWQIAPTVLLERLAAHGDPDAHAPGGGLVLVPRREMAWSNSIRCAGAGDEAVLHLHPLDAADRGIEDGGAATVTSEHGSVTVTAALDSRIRRGVASMTHGRTVGQPGGLTSCSVGVDPLTAMPVASGLAVTVSAVPASAVRGGAPG